MTNRTQEREAAARARCDAATKGPWHTEPMAFNDSRYVGITGDGEVITRDVERADGEFIAHARTDLPRSLDENQRLREELIAEWNHRAYRCPCSERQPESDTEHPAPWTECTCGLNQALWGQEGP